MIRVGLVGIGDAGKHHARALGMLVSGPQGARNDSELAWTAVCARDAAKAERFRDEVGAPSSARTVLGLDALIAARSCDAVILATPDELHPEQIVQCAAAGLHVLVEKPLASNLADAERAIAAARAAGVLLRVGYQLRHHNGHRLVYDRLVEVGTVRHIDVRWAWPDPAVDGWRAKGQGARFWSLAALGTHALDLVLWLGGPIAEVAAILERAGGPVDRAAELVLRLESGALAHVSTAITHRAMPRLSIVGDRGEFECTGTLGARGAGDIQLRLGAEIQPVAFDVGDPYLAQLRDFILAIPRGFVDDPALLANVSVLARI